MHVRKVEHASRSWTKQVGDSWVWMPSEARENNSLHVYYFETQERHQMKGMEGVGHTPNNDSMENTQSVWSVPLPLEQCAKNEQS